MIDKEAFFKLTYGLYIVSSTYRGKDSACVVNTVTQATSSPNQVTININKNNFTTDTILNSGKFNFVVLNDDFPMTTIQTFGFKSSKDHNKFENLHFALDSQGIKYLNHNVAALFSCQVRQTLDAGSHIIILAKVIEAKTLTAAKVLTYTDYHLIKKGITPKNAPSYTEPESKKGYRCTICGYIYEGDILPDDFICPICGAKATLFEKI